MTEQEEIRMLRLEKRAAELTAENAVLRKRVSDLQRMHDANQRHIARLTRSEADRVFGGQ